MSEYQEVLKFEPYTMTFRHPTWQEHMRNLESGYNMTVVPYNAENAIKLLSTLVLEIVLDNGPEITKLEEVTDVPLSALCSVISKFTLSEEEASEILTSTEDYLSGISAEQHRKIHPTVLVAELIDMGLIKFAYEEIMNFPLIMMERIKFAINCRRLAS